MQLRHCSSNYTFKLRLTFTLYLIHVFQSAVATESYPTLSTIKNHEPGRDYNNEKNGTQAILRSNPEELPRPNSTASYSAQYNCPSHCVCKYRPIPKILDIRCQLERKDTRSGTNGPDECTPVNVSNGVKQLIIRNATLDTKTILSLFPVIGENFLAHLELHHVIMNPVSFFNSHIFRFSHDSLQRLEISNANVYPTMEVSLNDKTPFRQFGRLKKLDSLTVRDSSPQLSNLIIQSLPVVNNYISITNSSISELFPEHFAHLFWLRSLNFSQNHITAIPARLTQNLRHLVTFDISQNRIEHLQENVFVGLVSLRKLNASHNKIRYVDTEVFNPLEDIQLIDLSHNDVIQIFEPYFTNNRKLKTLLMKNTWTANTFKNPETSARSRMEMERLINTLQSVQSLDLSDNEMKTIPETLTHVPKLTHVSLHGNQWSCSCQDRWFLYWIETTSISIGKPNYTNLWCHTGSGPSPLRDVLRNLKCPDPNIYNTNPSKYYTHMGLTALLHCHKQGLKWPKITWITPGKQQISHQQAHLSTDFNDTISPLVSPNLHVLDDGNLRVSSVTRNDFGLYICIAQYENLNITHYIHVGVDTSIFYEVRIMSFIIGWITSFVFLLIVVIAHIIRSLLHRCGLECVSVSKTYQARRVRAFFESMEQHKSTQLDWLRDNYNMQATKIKDNCYSQLERIRDSYTIQSKNLSEIREYGTNQLHQLRDQYHDQIRRVSGYSAHQLCKVRENYLFQRNRVSKFSSHQLLRLRETYKWQAQTLNKILENLPRTLNLDTCRGIGTCGRTDSIYLEDISDFQSIEDSFPDNKTGNYQFPQEKLEHVSLLIPGDLLVPALSSATKIIVLPEIQPCNNSLIVEADSPGSLPVTTNISSDTENLHI